MNGPDQTDEQLAALAAREGSDGPAFVELVRRHQEPIWRICYRLLGNAHDAQDVAQEVLVRMFAKRAQFAQRSRYSTWVHGIAVHCCLAARRSRGRRQKRVTTVDPASSPAEASTGDTTSGSGLSLDLAEMLDSLDEHDRALLILKHAENYTYDDLAAMFDISVSACKMRLSRAREKLQQRFPDA